MKKTYFVGIAKRGRTMVIQAVKCVDFLDCEIYDYYGAREITKKELKKNRYAFLAYMQAQKPKVYGDLRYAVVE